MAQPSFVIPAGETSPEALERKRRMAEALLAQAGDTSPVGHWSQGAARMAQALMGGIGMGRANSQEQAARQAAQQQFMELLTSLNGPQQPQAASMPAPAPQQGGALRQGGAPMPPPPPPAPAGPAGPDMGALSQVMGNPWLNSGQQKIGEALLSDMLKRRQPDYQFFEGVGGDRLRFNANDPNSKPELFYDAPDVPKPPISGENILIDPNTYKPVYEPPPEAAKPPDIAEFFDEKTGQPYKAQWNPATGQYERVGGTKAPSGTRLVVDPETGAVTFEQGSGMKPLTESQSKDTTFATRAEGSAVNLDRYQNALTSLVESTGGAVPVVGNYFKSDEYQLAEQAGNEFLTSLLRKDSGATITPDEQNNYGNIFLPRPGDGKSVILQKKEARTRAIAGIKAGMPPQAILAKEKALAGLRQSQQSTPPQAAIDALRAQPELAAQFDAKYGKGAAAHFLGGQFFGGQ